MNDWLTSLGENVESLKQYTDAFTEVPQTIHEIVSGRVNEVSRAGNNVESAMYHMKNRLQRIAGITRETDALLLDSVYNPKVKLDKPLNDKEQEDLRTTYEMSKTTEELQQELLRSEESFETISQKNNRLAYELASEQGNPDVAAARANLREVYNSSPLPLIHEEYIKNPEDFGLAA